MAEPFVPKEEYTRLPFDPNIRHRMEEMPNQLVYRALRGVIPEKEPESCYVAVQHAGKTYHLFNAARIPLGRMAELCAIYIRGKHKPTY